MEETVQSIWSTNAWLYQLCETSGWFSFYDGTVCVWHLWSDHVLFGLRLPLISQFEIFDCADVHHRLVGKKAYFLWLFNDVLSPSVAYIVILSTATLLSVNFIIIIMATPSAIVVCSMRTKAFPSVPHVSVLFFVSVVAYPREYFGFRSIFSEKNIVFISSSIRWLGLCAYHIIWSFVWV